jgi:hypothetical protein
VTLLRCRIAAVTAAALFLTMASPAAAARRVAVSLAQYFREMRVLLPDEGSNRYVVPTLQDRQALRRVADQLLKGDVAAAEGLLAAYPQFEVLDFDDAPAGGSYLALVEKAPITRGWGFFFFARAPLRPGLVLEAPHPIADRESEVAAANVATALRPSALLVAGSHRYADPGTLSDMAHAQVSVFEAVHEASMSATRVAVQIHGFSAPGHLGYPDLLLSAGTTAPGPAAQGLCETIARGGLGCTLFDGSAYTDLGATTNVQGVYTRRAFGADHFLHLETAELVRDDPAKMAVIADALAARWATDRPAGGCAAGGARSGLLSLLVVTALAAGRCRRRAPEAQS